MAVVIMMKDTVTGEKKPMYSADAREVTACKSNNWMPAGAQSAGVVAGKDAMDAKPSDDASLGPADMIQQKEREQRQAALAQEAARLTQDDVGPGERGGILVNASEPNAQNPLGPVQPTVGPAVDPRAASLTAELASIDAQVQPAEPTAGAEQSATQPSQPAPTVVPEPTAGAGSSEATDEDEEVHI